MNFLKDDLFTLDNALHSAVAVVFVLVTGFLGLPWPFGAALAALGLYLREASQVGWKWSLPDKDTGKPSLHKHLEWIVGSVAGALAGLITWVIF